MKKLLAMMLATSVLYVACSDSDDVQPRPKPGSISAVYLIDKETHTPLNVVGGNSKFEYSGDKVIKRIGGFISIPTSSGFSWLYTESIYDSVQYLNKNTVRIFTADNFEELNVASNEREITLEDGRMVRKITATDLETGEAADTIFYYYNAQNRIERTEQHFEWTIITRTYTFDAGGNLTKISGVKKYRDGEVAITTEETFGGYDNKPNPLKGLCLWQDYYYRSLSSNNFTSYTYTSGSTEETKNWTLVYDINGNVDYSK
jgi:major membrane immunogen (membrane-anchored lipoprotein)